MTTASAVRTLSLRDLEEHDPGARRRSGETRFLCPLPECVDHQRPALHRSLSANDQTGEWKCHRCEAAGILAEWNKPPQERPRITKRDRGMRELRRFVAPAPEPPPPDNTADTGRLRELLADVVSLAGTPGADYLIRRGIPEPLAVAAGARYSPTWYGRPAVVFPSRNADGRLKAAQGRLITDPQKGPNKLSAGPIASGVFATPGAWDAIKANQPVAIAEAPIDALSLAAAGLPAFAFFGKELGRNREAWFLAAVAFSPVWISFDFDISGEAAAVKLAAVLCGPKCGARARRLRPDAKDFNAQLLADGPDVLRQWISERIGNRAPSIVATPRQGEARRNNIPPDTVSSVLGHSEGKEGHIRPVPGMDEPFPSDLVELGAIVDAELEVLEYSGLLDAALDGALPVEPVQIGQGISTADPNQAAIAAAREFLRLHRAGRGNTAAANRERRMLQVLGAWWQGYPGQCSPKIVQ